MVTHQKTFTRIARRADILGGEPIIAGTRIPVRVIVQTAQFSPDLVEVNEAYPILTRADIEEALEFYAVNRDEIDRAIVENEGNASEGVT
ncbi:MAG: DUF433 domain-containing protein [Chloroflexota bacterium]|nr:DUF433 domain-containing protein [Chloroflexota bacterium]